MHKKVKQFATYKPLELIRMDLIGPTQIESARGKKYIFVAMDDFSRFTWVNFIREKSDTLCVSSIMFESASKEGIKNWLHSQNLHRSW